ncbi:MAG: PhnA domain-containing protein [Bacteroidota bacterium]
MADAHLQQDLSARSEAKCELCATTGNLDIYLVPEAVEATPDNSIWTCHTCREQIADPDTMDPHHWRCLNDSMWSAVPAVQVVSWRMLHRLKAEGWSQDLLDMMYLDEETLAWAKETGEDQVQEAAIKHLDSNGAQLQTGDSVVLIKDLNVKGANFTAKRGTAVRNISLVWDNAEQIEGRVNGQQIVILTQYVKKS